MLPTTAIDNEARSKLQVSKVSEVAEERAGFDEFYRQHRTTIATSLALTLGDFELATEATDEAMARAVQHWSRLQSFANPQGWVYRVAYNWATSVLRRRKRTDTLYSRAANEPFETPVLRIADPALDRAIADLPVGLRAVVVCRFHLDLSVADTADHLGIRPGTVKSRLNRAIERLQHALPKDSPND
jgi:RNA polymerase sigma-70 factor (ECF subfamily)